MATSNSIGASATAFSSLGTLFFTVMGFSQASEPSQISVFNSGQGFVGWAVMAWLGVVFVAFGWAGAAYCYARQHFSLALRGAILIAVSCGVEYTVLLFSPRFSPLVPSLVFTWGGMIFLQFLLALAGVLFTVKARSQFIQKVHSEC